MRICSEVVFCASSRITKASDLARVHHGVEGVVERPQVGIDLLGERPGQVAEALAGLDRRPRQDDPSDLAGVERLDGRRHGQVGLARPGRAEPEYEVGRADRLDVAPLVLAPRQDALAAAHLHNVALLEGAGGRGFVAVGHPDGLEDLLGLDLQPGGSQIVQIPEGTLGDLLLEIVAQDPQPVPPGLDLDPNLVLEDA
jgi:hypothetical protein